MMEFKTKADKIIKERYGVTVEHVSAGVTYEDMFYRVVKPGGTSINAGHIYGFPMVKGAWCNKLKVRALNRIDKHAVSYIGIAYDEPKRFKILSQTKRSPLVEARWTEAMCYDWRKQRDLLSPIYQTANRGGCWFCHYQTVDQLRQLRKNYPDYWKLLLKWDDDSPISFHPKHTVHDFEKRFSLEDSGALQTDRSFRWAEVSN